MKVIYVTTFRRLYRRDVMNLVCLDSGAGIKLGYKRDWVQPDLLAGLDTLAGQQALVVYCDWVSDTQEYVYRPIRWVTIERIEPVGQRDIVIDVRLQRRIKYVDADQALEKLLEAFHAHIDAAEARPNTTPDERAKKRAQVFVADLPDDKLKLDVTDDGWPEMARFLSEHSSLNDGVFVRELGHVSNPLPRTWGGSRPEFNAVSGTSYELRLRMIPGRNAPRTARPSVTISRYATTLGPFLEQAGAATDADFTIVVDRTDEPLKTLVRVSVTCPEAAAPPVTGPEVSGVLQIQPPRFAMWLSLALAVGGLVLASIGPDLKEEFKDVPALYWVLKAAGWALFAFGTFLATRKLPSKGPG